MAKSSIGKYLRTLSFLQKKQIVYKIYYLFKNYWPLKKKYSSKNFKVNKEFSFNNFIINKESYQSKNKFIFLNIEKKFINIDWNYMENGKLWNYNLCYFDFLNQKKIFKNEYKKIIYDFFNFKHHISGNESYTVSLRSVNIIKYISEHNIHDRFINFHLYNSYLRLKDNLEYHILGNHLLENAFSLLFGSIYFKNITMFKISEKILLEQLEEQILNDGAHFELSPMYHSITLHKVLDSINLLRNNKVIESKNLEKKLEEKAAQMVSWLSQISMLNKNIPHFNDSTYMIAPNVENLMNYANRLKISSKQIKLNDSGYRKYFGENYEIVVDYGEIGPSYLPGHGHSDTFNFELHCYGKPLIVDTGISTYENNNTRHLERSTQSHNTLTVEDKNQSEVWSSFRVGQRANIIEFKEGMSYISGIHDGYKNENIFHKRSFNFSLNEIHIEDVIKNYKGKNLKSFLHFAPESKIELNDNQIKINNVIIRFKNYRSLKIKPYKYSLGYNNQIIADKIVGIPKHNSEIIITI